MVELAGALELVASGIEQIEIDRPRLSMGFHNKFNAYRNGVLMKNRMSDNSHLAYFYLHLSELNMITFVILI